MLYLLASILFMALMAITFRAASERDANALGMSVVFRLGTGIAALAAGVFLVDLDRLAELWHATGWLALIAAVFYWSAGFTALKAVETGHLGMTWTINRLSMVIPTLASIIYWQEIPLQPVELPLLLRGAGIVLAVTTVVCLGIDRIRERRLEADFQVPVPRHHNTRTWGLWLACAFLSQGGWETSLRATRAMESDADRAFFIGMVFVLSGLFSLPILGVFRPRVGRVELKFGALAAVCAAIGSATRPWALRELPGVIVFPVTTVAVTLLVIGAGIFFWRERIGRWGIVGMVIAIAGILLLTVPLGG